jgi:manganese efflux pump family protein
VQVLAFALWTLTALLGLNLAIKAAVLRGLVHRQHRAGRSGVGFRRRMLLLAIHVTAAATGLLLWLWYLMEDMAGAGAVAVLLLAVAASHGFLMVSRWVPGHGRHADASVSVRRPSNYFPVHAATAHAMAGAATLTTLLLIVFRQA